MTAGVLVEPRGNEASVVGSAAALSTVRRGRGVGGDSMYLAATDAELVLLALGRGLRARRLNGLVVARVDRATVLALDLADPGAPPTSRGTVDMTVRMIDGDEWPLSVAAGQHATAAELARVAG